VFCRNWLCKFTSRTFTEAPFWSYFDKHMTKPYSVRNWVQRSSLHSPPHWHSLKHGRWALLHLQFHCNLFCNWIWSARGASPAPRRWSSTLVPNNLTCWQVLSSGDANICIGSKPCPDQKEFQKLAKIQRFECTGTDMEARSIDFQQNEFFRTFSQVTRIFLSYGLTAHIRYFRLNFSKYFITMKFSYYSKPNLNKSILAPN